MDMLKTHLVTLKLEGKTEINTFEDILDKCIKLQKVMGFELKPFTQDEFELIQQLILNIRR